MEAQKSHKRHYQNSHSIHRGRKKANRQNFESMERLEVRAVDILDRLEDMNIGLDLVEADLVSERSSTSLKKACLDLATMVSNLCAESLKGDIKGVVACIEEIYRDRNLESGLDKNKSKLDSELVKLLRILDTNDNSKTRIDVLEKIITFTQASIILKNSRSDDQNVQSLQKEDFSEASKSLMSLFKATMIKCEPDTENVSESLKLLDGKIRKMLSSLPSDLTAPIISEKLDGGQMDNLGEIYESFRSEYRLRRKMLLERAHVTIQSFLWSKRLDELETRKEVEAILRNFETSLNDQPSVDMRDFLKASISDLISVSQKVTSGSQSRTQASVKNVLIGEVPDRGGRPEGRAADARNSQSFTAPLRRDAHWDHRDGDFAQRRLTDTGSQGRHYGRGGGRGDSHRPPKVQGGWQGSQGTDGGSQWGYGGGEEFQKQQQQQQRGRGGHGRGRGRRG